MASNFVLNLTEYVKEIQDVILQNIAIGRGTRELISIQTGVKYKARLHPFKVTATFQDGSGCGFNALGAVDISEREITAPAIKINLELCPDDLIATYAEYLVFIRAQESPMPFEQYIIDGLIADIQDQVDTLIWQGDTASEDTTIQWADGFLKIANAEAAVIDVAIAEGATAYDGIRQVIAAIPPKVLKRGQIDVFVAPEIFMSYMQDMVAANLYHYAPGVDTVGEAVVPGTNVRVISTYGLSGSKQILATFPKNLYYATDLENSTEEVKVWFSDDADMWRIKIKWNSGMQIALPDEVVLGTFAAAPVAAERCC